MIFVVSLTVFFLCIFYSCSYLKRKDNKLNFSQKRFVSLEKEKSVAKMSDEEFCDPSGASNHWHKKNTNRRLIRPNTSLFHWKRTFSSDISGANQSNKKKQKLIKYVDLTDNEPKEFCDTSEDSNENCYKTNVNTILQARQKRTIPSETPDTSQNNKLKPEISNCARLSDSEIHTSDDSDDTKSPTKNIFSTNDLSNIHPIAQQSSSKNNEIEDHKNTQFINHLKSLVKYDTNDILLPPGMPPVIAGVPVKFPVTPYKSQISVMNAVIKGCKNRENCLLESPTGSGKTLALLCAALAWQTYFIKNVIAEAETIHTSPSHGTSSKSYSNNLGDKSKNNKVRIPKIFYGSRTHKQIKQLIGELKKTAYSDIPMTILNSREHSCIQPSQKGVTKTQQCNELLDPTKNRKCQFYGENYKSIATHGKLNNLGFETPWDIEDLVELGRRKRACPYFATRDLMLEANIIFCPYNYLIDPSIRDAMQIQIDGHVIIVDEAHNIEDICRNVGSYFLREDYLTEAIEDITLVFNYKQNSAYKSLYAYLAVLLNLIKDQLLQTQNSQKNPNDEITTAFWTGEEIWILFETYKLTGDTYENFIQDCKTAIEDYNKLKDDIKIDQLTNEEQKNKKYNKKNMAINFTTKNLIDDLQTALKYISVPGYQMSYRCTISQSFHQDAKEKISENTWISGHGGKRLRTLKFLCMNSEVTFSEIAKKARCVILASGTLSPIVSFESELGIKFPHKLHANHVVTKDQVYVRAISHGPSGTILKATYQNIQTLPFKDDLGRLIKEVCESIPHGILCFFASYTAMRSNIERWQDTDLWEELNQCKRIFVEPRKHSELDDVMMEYREAVESTGALLLAVFRGKVAEGIDFSDNYARCVITIGIPFAVQTDPDVRLKREYNETNRSKGLLTGSEWYTVQAYRALNQALGRCIRHKNDWGAVLLVDERLLSSNSIMYLPKWIREMRLEGSYDLKNELKEFVRKQKEIKQELVI